MALSQSLTGYAETPVAGEDTRVQAPSAFSTGFFEKRTAERGITGAPKEKTEDESERPLKAPDEPWSPKTVEEKVAAQQAEVKAHRERRQKFYETVTKHPRYEEFKNLMASQQELKVARKEVKSRCAESTSHSCQKQQEVLKAWEADNEAKRQEMAEVFGEAVSQYGRASADLAKAETQLGILRTFGNEVSRCEGSPENIHQCAQSRWDGARSPGGLRTVLEDTVLFDRYDGGEVPVEATEKNTDGWKGITITPLGQPGGEKELRTIEVPPPDLGGVLVGFDGRSLAEAFEFARNAYVPETELEESWKEIHLQSVPHENVDALVIVSMAALTREASAYTQQWETLPEALRYPGRMARLRGVVVVPSSGDVVLVGGQDESIDSEQYLSIDDLIVAFRAALQQDQTPGVSIDPDPEDFFRPHVPRVLGVPADSGFARTLLDTDYRMKQILYDAAKLNIPDLSSTITRENLATAQQVARQGNSLGSRFWLYPIRPFPGSILMTPDQTTVMFQNGVQVLTEETLFTQKGVVGAGKTLEPDQRIAMAFTRNYRALTLQEPLFRKTEGLFDLVFAANLLKEHSERMPWLESFAGLPYRRVSIPENFAPFSRDYSFGAATVRVCGGVRIQNRINASSLLQVNQTSLRRIRQVAMALSESGEVSASVPDTSIRLASIDYDEWDRETLNTLKIVKELTQGRYESAHGTIQGLLGENPYNPYLHLMKAVALQGQMEFEAAEQSAHQALVLGGKDRLVTASVAVTLADLYTCQGQPDRAMAEIEQALRTESDNPWLHFMQAELLWQFGKKAEARQAFRRATNLAPALALPYASQAMLEAQEGYLFRAKKLAKKAYFLAPGNPDIQADLALMDMFLRQVDEGEFLAREVLEHPGSMPHTRFKSHFALALGSAVRGNWEAMEAHTDQALAILPNNAELLTVAAEWAEEMGNRSLAQKYFEQARRLLPGSP